ncbi:MAG: glycine cleavage system aminomethyltransferase GcvT [Actinomycetota bacterium]
MLNVSPLDAKHRSLGAKMGAFAGWDMPISYGGTVAEHTAVRERVGLFDVSHLGKIMVSGPHAAAFLDGQLTNHMADLKPGRARYSLICNEDGGIIDDLIVYAVDADGLLVVPNASNRDAVYERLRAAAPDGVSVAVLDWTTLAVQGPESPAIVDLLYPGAKDLGYMRVMRAGDVVVSRSGYTGEVGYEVFTTEAAASENWDRLLDGVRAAGGEPCGLAARDTLRLEMGYPLHGNDIDPETRPDEAGLMWAVSLDGREFPGARAIREGTPRKTLIGLRMTDKLIPRHGYEVRAHGEPIGECTSGTFSPTLRMGIAMAYVKPGSVDVGDAVEVDVRGRAGHADVVKPPFVSGSPK